MLVLARRLDQKFQIGPDISVQVVELGYDQVRLGIQAPRQVKVMRTELMGPPLKPATPADWMFYEMLQARVATREHVLRTWALSKRRDAEDQLDEAQTRFLRLLWSDLVKARTDRDEFAERFCLPEIVDPPLVLPAGVEHRAG
jgi:carbon storage regulator CsrA